VPPYELLEVSESSGRRDNAQRQKTLIEHRETSVNYSDSLGADEQLGNEIEGCGNHLNSSIVS
jgi:hypothetical protein